MTSLRPPGPAPASWRSWHRPLTVFSAVMVVTAAVSAVGLVVDDRVLVGAPIWAKPLKFSLSLTAYCLSLAWMLAQLPRGRRVGWWAGTVIALASLVEMVIIVGQVVRGRRSHFNVETPLDAALFSVMGTTIVVLWVATLVLAVLLLRADVTDRASAWAMRAGVLLALAGAAVGFLMTTPRPGQRPDVTGVVGAHGVGVADGGPAMPLTGWSTTGGDLRIPHFVGMHALQVLPLLVMVLAALAPRFARLADGRVRARLVRLASGAYAAVVLLVLWQALAGRPLHRPDGAMSAAAMAVLATVAVGGVLSLRTAPAARAGDVEDGITAAPTVLTGGRDPGGRPDPSDAPAPADGSARGGFTS